MTIQNWKSALEKTGLSYNKELLTLALELTDAKYAILFGIEERGVRYDFTYKKVVFFDSLKSFESFVTQNLPLLLLSNLNYNEFESEDFIQTLLNKFSTVEQIHISTDKLKALIKPEMNEADYDAVVNFCIETFQRTETNGMNMQLYWMGPIDLIAKTSNPHLAQLRVDLMGDNQPFSASDTFNKEYLFQQICCLNNVIDDVHYFYRVVQYYEDMFADYDEDLYLDELKHHMQMNESMLKSIKDCKSTYLQKIVTSTHAKMRDLIAHLISPYGYSYDDFGVKYQ
jgi:hypothetical protein